MVADVLLLEDDKAYAAEVDRHFTGRDPRHLRVHHVFDLESAQRICREHDIRVAIIDLALGNGAIGTAAIGELWKLDKKIIFIIHSVHPPESIADWSAQTGVPYTSQYFLRKSGSVPSLYADDAARLYELTEKALRAYVPHVPPSLRSVGNVVALVNQFFEIHPTLRSTAIISNIHHSQDIINSISLWAADRLSRAGFDSIRIAVLLTGSFARLEATEASDADYFVVFDDSGLGANELSEVIELAYYSFIEVAAWFERNGIPVHEADHTTKRPENIRWHTTTLPTWFPITTLTKQPLLGHATQFELTKQWLLLESAAIFNPALVASLRARLAEGLGIVRQKTVRDAIAHSSLSESLRMLVNEFDDSFGERAHDSLTVVKHYFMRRLNLFSLRLWLVRCFLDPDVFNDPSESLLDYLSPFPIARIIEFCHFLVDVPVLKGKSRRQALSSLKDIVNLYAEAAYSFGSQELRDPGATVERKLINDLEDAARACGEHINIVLALVSESDDVGRHAALRGRGIV